MNVTSKNSQTGISLGKHDVHQGQSVEFFVLPPSKPNASLEIIPPDSLMAGFWWVSTTSEKKNANMEMSTVTQNGLDIPVMKNIVELEPHTKLTTFVAQKAKPIVPVKNGADIAKGQPTKKKQKKA